MRGSDLAKGAASGFLATAPMTLAMEGMFAALPGWEKYPLPPRVITEQMEGAAGVDAGLDEPQHLALTLANHFAYGAGAGALYGALQGRLPGPPALKGAAYGLAVWGASYHALLPAIGWMRPATEHPARRKALMIGAHLVWGSALGVVFDRLARGRGQETAGDHSEGPESSHTTPTNASGEVPPHALHAL